MNDAILTEVLKHLESDSWDHGRLTVKNSLVALHEAIHTLMDALSTLTQKVNGIAYGEQRRRISDSKEVVRNKTTTPPLRSRSHGLSSQQSTKSSISHSTQRVAPTGNSHSEKLREIWELYRNLQGVRGKAEALHQAAVPRAETSPKEQYLSNSTAEILDVLSVPLLKNKKLIENYFTKEEKLHYGTATSLGAEPPVLGTHLVTPPVTPTLANATQSSLNDTPSVVDSHTSTTSKKTTGSSGRHSTSGNKTNNTTISTQNTGLWNASTKVAEAAVPHSPAPFEPRSRSISPRTSRVNSNTNHHHGATGTPAITASLRSSSHTSHRSSSSSSHAIHASPMRRASPTAAVGYAATELQRRKQLGLTNAKLPKSSTPNLPRPKPTSTTATPSTTVSIQTDMSIPLEMRKKGTSPQVRDAYNAIQQTKHHAAMHGDDTSPTNQAGGHPYARVPLNVHLGTFPSRPAPTAPSGTATTAFMSMSPQQQHQPQQYHQQQQHHQQQPHQQQFSTTPVPGIIVQQVNTNHAGERSVSPSASYTSDVIDAHTHTHTRVSTAAHSDSSSVVSTSSASQRPNASSVLLKECTEALQESEQYLEDQGLAIPKSPPQETIPTSTEDDIPPSIRTCQSEYKPYIIPPEQRTKYEVSSPHTDTNDTSIGVSENDSDRDNTLPTPTNIPQASIDDGASPTLIEEASGGISPVSNLSGTSSLTSPLSDDSIDVREGARTAPPGGGMESGDTLLLAMPTPTLASSNLGTETGVDTLRSSTASAAPPPPSSTSPPTTTPYRPPSATPPLSADGSPVSSQKSQPAEGGTKTAQSRPTNDNPEKTGGRQSSYSLRLQQIKAATCKETGASNPLSAAQPSINEGPNRERKEKDASPSKSNSSSDENFTLNTNVSSEMSAFNSDDDLPMFDEV